MSTKTLGQLMYETRWVYRRDRTWERASVETQLRYKEAAKAVVEAYLIRRAVDERAAVVSVGAA